MSETELFQKYSEPVKEEEEEIENDLPFYSGLVNLTKAQIAAIQAEPPAVENMTEPNLPPVEETTQPPVANTLEDILVDTEPPVENMTEQLPPVENMTEPGPPVENMTEPGPPVENMTEPRSTSREYD